MRERILKNKLKNCILDLILFKEHKKLRIKTPSFEAIDNSVFRILEEGKRTDYIIVLKGGEILIYKTSLFIPNLSKAKLIKKYAINSLI